MYFKNIFICRVGTNIEYIIHNVIYIIVACLHIGSPEVLGSCSHHAHYINLSFTTCIFVTNVVKDPFTVTDAI